MRGREAVGRERDTEREIKVGRGRGVASRGREVMRGIREEVGREKKEK